MKPILSSLLAAGCALLLFGTARSADLRLRSESRALGNVVRLADVADIVAASPDERQTLGEIELIPAPTAGKQRQLSVREIQDTLERRGMNMLDCRFSGASQVTIVGVAEPAAKPISRPTKLPLSAIQEAERAATSAVVRHLQQASSSDDPWTVNIDLTDAQAQLVLADVHHVEARGGQAPWIGRQDFEIEVRGEKVPSKFILTAQVSMPSAVVVTNKPIPRGTILQDSDVALERLKPGAVPGDAFQSIEQVIGREAVLAIAPGQTLSQQYIRSPLLVKRGNVVTVYVRSPGVRIRTTGRAREDGGQGDNITVESLLDRKTFIASVTGIDQLEIASDASTSATVAADGQGQSKAGVKSIRPVVRASYTQPAR